jgi:hypothetical protein
MGVVIRRYEAQTVILPRDVVIPSDATPYLQGVAVATRLVGDTTEYCVCGALLADYADAFYGFLRHDGLSDQTALVITGRGSVVTPVVEIPLIPDGAVFLSTIPGRVTPVPPQNVAGARVIRVGTALTASTLVLITDASYWVPADS